MVARAGLSYRFTHAITRKPADSVANGLRAVDTGDPSGDAFRAEHELYVKALQDAGLTVDVLPQLESESCASRTIWKSFHKHSGVSGQLFC